MEYPEHPGYSLWQQENTPCHPGNAPCRPGGRKSPWHQENTRLHLVQALWLPGKASWQPEHVTRHQGNLPGIKKTPACTKELFPDTQEVLLGTLGMAP